MTYGRFAAPDVPKYYAFGENPLDGDAANPTPGSFTAKKRHPRACELGGTRATYPSARTSHVWTYGFPTEKA